MEKSAIPSKGDRGRSESDIERDLTPDTRGRHDERYVCDRMRARSCSGQAAAEPYHRPAPLSQDGFAPRDRMNGTATGTLTRPRESSTADIVSGSAPTRGPSVARLSKVPALPDSAGAAAPRWRDPSFPRGRNHKVSLKWTVADINPRWRSCC